jgi:serine/threonine protein kinase
LIPLSGARILDPVPPRRVGPYEIVSVIGRGGIGTVYRALDERSGRPAAVKVLGPAPAVDATAARRLTREYEVLRALDHPHVVRVYEAGVSDGYSFLAMELVQGLDLRAYLSPVIDDEDLVPLPFEVDTPYPASPGSPQGLEPGAAVRALAAMLDEPDTEPHGLAPHRGTADGHVCPPRSLLSPEVRGALNRPSRIERLRVALGQVTDALSYVHGRGLVHRDIKPSNIMVDDHRQARLMDFGLVKTAAQEGDDGLTQLGRVVGTYRYMAPEQAQGLPVDGRSDLYSLGVILYELLTCAPPFLASDPVTLWREILSCRPSPIASSNPGADPRLAALAERLLEKDPANRPQSAEEVKAALAP